VSVLFTGFDLMGFSKTASNAAFSTLTRFLGITFVPGFAVLAQNLDLPF
jgi:hypothetical protein